jgi:hypothetical protein
MLTTDLVYAPLQLMLLSWFMHLIAYCTYTLNCLQCHGAHMLALLALPLPLHWDSRTAASTVAATVAAATTADGTMAGLAKNTHS